MRRRAGFTPMPDGIPVPPLAEVVARVIIQQLPDSGFGRKTGSGLPIGDGLGYRCPRFNDVFCQSGCFDDGCLLK